MHAMSGGGIFCVRVSLLLFYDTQMFDLILLLSVLPLSDIEAGALSNLGT